MKRKTKRLGSHIGCGQEEGRTVRRSRRKRRRRRSTVFLRARGRAVIEEEEVEEEVVCMHECLCVSVCLQHTSEIALS